MSRQLRLLYPGALYHVTARGNGRRAIYRSDADRAAFLDLLGSVVERFSWICHGYCLMGNHFHLLVETPVPNLPGGMQRLNGCYAQSCNRRWQRVGHLFQGRYKAILVEKQAYLLELVRHVNLNPVRAGWCAVPEEWRWSGYRSLLGLSARPRWLETDWVLRQFSPERATARKRVRQFVAAGISSPVELPVTADLYLAGDDLIRTVAGRLEPAPEIPRAQWQPLRPPLESLLRDSPHPLRAARAHGYTLREIGESTGLHYSTISRRIEKCRQQEETNG